MSTINTNTGSTEREPLSAAQTQRIAEVASLEEFYGDNVSNLISTLFDLLQQDIPPEMVVKIGKGFLQQILGNPHMGSMVKAWQLLKYLTNGALRAPVVFTPAERKVITELLGRNSIMNGDNLFPAVRFMQRLEIPIDAFDGEFSSMREGIGREMWPKTQEVETLIKDMRKIGYFSEDDVKEIGRQAVKDNYDQEKYLLYNSDAFTILERLCGLSREELKSAIVEFELPRAVDASGDNFEAIKVALRKRRIPLAALKETIVARGLYHMEAKHINLKSAAMLVRNLRPIPAPLKARAEQLLDTVDTVMWKRWDALGSLHDFAEAFDMSDRPIYNESWDDKLKEDLMETKYQNQANSKAVRSIAKKAGIPDEKVEDMLDKAIIAHILGDKKDDLKKRFMLSDDEVKQKVQDMCESGKMEPAGVSGIQNFCKKYGVVPSEKIRVAVAQMVEANLSQKDKYLGYDIIAVILDFQIPLTEKVSKKVKVVRKEKLKCGDIDGYDHITKVIPDLVLTEAEQEEEKVAAKRGMRHLLDDKRDMTERVQSIQKRFQLTLPDPKDMVKIKTKKFEASVKTWVYQKNEDGNTSWNLTLKGFEEVPEEDKMRILSEAYCGLLNISELYVEHKGAKYWLADEVIRVYPKLRERTPELIRKTAEAWMKNEGRRKYPGNSIATMMVRFGLTFGPESHDALKKYLKNLRELFQWESSKRTREEIMLTLTLTHTTVSELMKEIEAEGREVAG